MTELDAVPLTAKLCREVAAETRSALASLGVTVKASEFDAMLREAEWLGSFAGDPFEPTGACGSDTTRTYRAFLLMDQLTRLAETLHWATGIDKAPGVAKWITGKIDRMVQQDSQAQDYLFELEIAARFRRWRALTVSLDEPDIVLTPSQGGPSISIACKRPRRMESVGQAILKAREQITRRGHQGVIVVGMESIFHSTANAGRPTGFYVARDRQHLQSKGRRLIDAVVEITESDIQKSFSSWTLGGILFCGIITGLLVKPPSYIPCWVGRGIANRNDYHHMLYIVERLLFSDRD